jgi:flagellar basal body-associated protein FliL
MSMSKEKKARRELALKKAKRKKILIIIAGAVVLAGIVTAMVVFVDWENVGMPQHTHGEACGDDGC